MKNIVWQASPIALLVLALTACGQQDAPAVQAPPAASPPTQTSTLVEYTMPEGLTDAGYCALDAINGTRAGAPVTAGSPVTFGGWAADADKKSPENAVLVLKGNSGSYSAEITGGVERPDVAASLGSDALMNSGFNVSTVLQDVPPGDYQLEIIHSDPVPARCPLNTVLTVIE